MALLSTDPRIFSTLHLYTAPLSPLIRFDRVRVSDEESTVLLPCLVHVMFGCGLLVALQNRVTPLSSTTCSVSGALTISAESASFKQSEEINKEYNITISRFWFLRCSHETKEWTQLMTFKTNKKLFLMQ